MSYLNSDGDPIVETQDLVVTYEIGGAEIDVIGFNWNVDRERWEYYDIWCGDEHLNVGEPWDASDGPATREQVEDFVHHHHADLLN